MSHFISNDKVSSLSPNSQMSQEDVIERNIARSPSPENVQLNFEQMQALTQRTVSLEVIEEESSEEEPEVDLAHQTIQMVLETMFNTGEVMSQLTLPEKGNFYNLIQNSPCHTRTDSLLQGQYKAYKQLSLEARERVFGHFHLAFKTPIPSRDDRHETKRNGEEEVTHVFFDPKVISQLYKVFLTDPNYIENPFVIELFLLNSLETISWVFSYCLDQKPEGPVEKRLNFFNVSIKECEILEILLEAFNFYKDLPVAQQLKNATLLTHCFLELYRQIIDVYITHFKEKVQKDLLVLMNLVLIHQDVSKEGKEAAKFYKDHIAHVFNKMKSHPDGHIPYFSETIEYFNSLQRQAYPVLDYAKHYLAAFGGDLDSALASSDLVIPEALDAFLTERKQSLDEFHASVKKGQDLFYSKEGSFNEGGFHQDAFFKQRLLFKLQKHLNRIQETYDSFKLEIKEGETLTSDMHTKMGRIDDIVNKFSDLSFVLSVRAESEATQLMQDLQFMNKLVDDLFEEFKQSKMSQKPVQPSAPAAKFKGKKPPKSIGKKGKGKQSGPVKVKPIKVVSVPIPTAPVEISAVVQVSSEPILVSAQPLPKPEPKKPFYVPEVEQQPEPEIVDEMEMIRRRLNQQIQSDKETINQAREFFCEKLKGEEEIIQKLFDPKTNRRNFLSQEDMTRIVSKLQRQEAPSPTPPEEGAVKTGQDRFNLKGAPGVKYRVEGSSEVYATHSHSAKVGGRGHGGAVKDFKEYLLRYFMNREK